MSSHASSTAGTGLGRLRRYTWYSLNVIPLALALLSVVQVVRADRWMPLHAVVLLIVAVLASGNVWWFNRAMYLDDDTAVDAREWSVFAVLAILTIVGATIATKASIDAREWPLLAGSLTSALVVRMPSGRRLVTACGAVLGTAAVATPLVGFDRAVMVTVIVVLVTLAVYLQWWYFEVALRLESAHQLARDLAVADERLRFAAELHDIQGHHLQVIALKSELAARLTADRPAAAAEHMKQIQQLAVTAIKDSRAVAAGYREVSLDIEVGNATRVLQAAGVRATATGFDDLSGLSEQQQRLLGLLVREATTNMLRHADPSVAGFRLRDGDGTIELVIDNDAATDTAETGSGLRTLAERFDSAGGELRHQRTGDVFVVTAGLRLDGGPT